MKHKKKWKWLLLIIPIVLILMYFGYMFYFKYSFIDKYSKNLVDMGDGLYYSENLLAEGGIVGESYFVCAPRLIDGAGAELSVGTAETYYMYDDGSLSENSVKEYYDGIVTIAPFTYHINVRVRIGYKSEDGTIQQVIYDLDKDKNPIDQENWSSVQKEQFDQQQDVIDEIYLHLNEQWGIVEK